METIAENLAAVKATLPEGVQLVAVSKFHPAEYIAQAYAAGQRIFGESRVQELAAKVPALPADILWHFIGHLQTNKVRQLLRLRPALIESVDSMRLLEALDAEAAAQGVVQNVLLQLHVAQEETKTGFLPDEMLEYFRTGGYRNLKALHIKGVMGMATNTDDPGRINADFAAIAATHRAILELCPDLRGFTEISMGMSHDYPLAIANGATLVRVGTAIFGLR